MSAQRPILSICGALTTLLLIAGCKDPGSATAEQATAHTEFLRNPPATTPPGLTLVDAVQELETSQPSYQWTRLGDARGATLFVSAQDTQGVSRCVEACATLFPPVEAPADARGFGDWSVITRADGKRQRAYQGKPLYTFSKEQRPDEVTENVVLQELKAKNAVAVDAQRQDLDGTAILPPQGWSIAHYEPTARLQKPSVLRVVTLATQEGVGPGLVDARGMTLYGYDGKLDTSSDALCVDTPAGKAAAGNCSGRFQPALAASATQPVGDFTIITRKSDGARQWAYRSVPLYTFSGDSKPGDTLGTYRDGSGRWHAVMLTLDAFPDDVQIVRAVGRDMVLADLKGYPLYMRGRFEDRWGGYTAFHGFSNAYRMGKMVGTRGCSAQCLKTRRPVQASAGARPHGYWEVLDRSDGTRQWAYKGFALYKYLPDRPGISTGNNVLDYVIGDAGPYTVAMARDGEPPQSSGKATALYWYLARP